MIIAIRFMPDQDSHVTICFMFILSSHTQRVFVIVLFVCFSVSHIQIESETNKVTLEEIIKYFICIQDLTEWYNVWPFMLNYYFGPNMVMNIDGANMCTYFCLLQL